jgi:hypothetical protein
MYISNILIFRHKLTIVCGDENDTLILNYFMSSLIRLYLGIFHRSI